MSFITDTLQKHAYKLTATRKEIAGWVDSTHGIFSVKEIAEELQELDLVSIYRTIELFQSLDLIHIAHTMHGEIHYEKHEQKHHHHVVCTKCESTDCIEACDVPVPKKITKKYSDIHHTIMFTGICKTCT